MTTAEAIARALEAPNEHDCQSEMPANITDAIFALSRAAECIREAITPNVMPGHDAAGGTVSSLTEAMMGITAGLVRIADAISQLASAVSER